jgi:hypothetical protein
MPIKSNREFNRFIYNSIANESNILEENSPFYALIVRIDSLFRKAIRRPMNDGDELFKLLISRSHSYYLNSTRMAMSGATPEAFALSRGAIESVLYAFYVFKDFESGTLWLTRADNKNKFRNTFTIRKTLEKLKSINSVLSDDVAKAYEHSIDFGAHPNEMSITSNITITKTVNQREFQFHYLSQSLLSRYHCLQETIKVGLLALYVMSEADESTLYLASELIEIKKLFEILCLDLVHALAVEA